MKNHALLKFICVVASAWLINSTLYAQQTPKTPEELEAFINSVRKKSDSMQNVVKNKKTPANSTGSSKTTTKPEKKQTAKTDQLPSFDSARVSGLPKKVYTITELSSYLSNLYDQLCKKFPADAVSSAKTIASKLGNHPAKLEAAALQAWQNGADEEAVLLVTKGAASSGSDGLVLVNAGAILDMYGLPEKAIPVLRTVVNYDPKNVIALNNLGQAYTALGLQDSAMQYLGRCISLSSQHPQANNTAGHIELKKGNKAKAQAYFENSIRGSFNLSAYTGLKEILKDKCRIAKLVKPKVKMPEYFNQFKYKLPRQCLNVNEAPTVQEEFNAYKKMLNNTSRSFDKLKKEAEKNMGAEWAANFNKQTMEKISKGQSYMKPFQALGIIIEAETTLGYHDDLADLEKFNKENRDQYKRLEKEYKDAYEQMMQSGSHDCGRENELKNKYLERFAQLNEEWQSRNMLVENKYIDDFLYWCYFSAFDEKDYRHRFYSYVYNYLYKVNWLAQVKILEPCQETEPGEIEQPGQKELKEFNCPANLQLSFVVGKLTANCEKISFKAGELIVFKYEKKFTGKRETTLSIGGGGGVDLTESAGPVKAGFEAGMDMSMYFTFDKAGNCTDAGMAYNAYRGMGVDFSAGERINLNRNLGYTGEEIGWRFGINSGVSFTTPGVPWMKDIPETPVNKNVRIYNPN
ncbi:MAG: tetratricopeptide repeat protein [Chitinophagaceae bacterium]